jgi:hypothetical protein
LAISGIGIAWGVFLLAPDAPAVARLSLGTAYAGLLFLATALIIGPIRLIAGASNPVSNYLRRDIGIPARLYSMSL